MATPQPSVMDRLFAKLVDERVDELRTETFAAQEASAAAFPARHEKLARAVEIDDEIHALWARINELAAESRKLAEEALSDLGYSEDYLEDAYDEDLTYAPYSARETAMGLARDVDDAFPAWNYSEAKETATAEVEARLLTKLKEAAE